MMDPRCFLNRTKPLKPSDTQPTHVPVSRYVHRLWHLSTPSCLTQRVNLAAKAASTDSPRNIHFYRFRLNDFKSFNSLFKVLFIFPSQYLFAIGFLQIFSLRRSLSPALCTSINVHDSSTDRLVEGDTTYGAFTLSGVHLQALLHPPPLSDQPSDYNSPNLRSEITILGFSRFHRLY